MSSRGNMLLCISHCLIRYSNIFNFTLLDCNIRCIELFQIFYIHANSDFVVLERRTTSAVSYLCKKVESQELLVLFTARLGGGLSFWSDIKSVKTHPWC